VTEAEEIGGGWGAVVRVAHRVGPVCVESLYAHFLDFQVTTGDRVRRGQVLGHVGTANGRYKAHLHLEVRAVVGSELGHGYGVPLDQVDPHQFIDAHRPPVRGPTAR
jgi:murein DD-endopeptidase MepM/ murein hydrolase activator NlpD